MAPIDDDALPAWQRQSMDRSLRAARARAATVFLPFEGDGILTSILAKAFVLAGE